MDEVLKFTGFIYLFEKEWKSLKRDLMRPENPIIIPDYYSGEIKPYVMNCLWFLFCRGN